jgi:nucleotide-binding universal stress UspA family protein
MIKNILVCLEGSESTATTTLTAIEIAHELNASLSGIAIIDKPDIQATGHSIVSTLSNAEALAEFGQTIDVGMVVMGAFARSRMAELFGGSATRALAEHSQTPLYLQH